MNARQIASRLALRAANGLAVTALALGLAASTMTPTAALAAPSAAPFAPDLVPYFDGANARPGGSAGFYAGVTNYGGSAAGPLRLVIAVPSDLTDIAIEPGNFTCSRSVDVINCTLPSLASGRTQALIVYGTASRTTGYYGVMMNVDPNNRVPESNEQNNSAVFRLASF